MDIQIVSSATGEVWTEGRRDLGHPDWTDHQAFRMPKETRAIRAAEYGLEPDDPLVLDLVWFEPLYALQAQVADEIHPLFRERHVAGALEIVTERVELVKAEHRHPDGLTLAGTIMAKEIKTTAGLMQLESQSQRAARKCYASIRDNVATIRDYHREQLAGVKIAPPDLAASLAAQVARLKRR